ncbi:DNA repair protein RecN [Gemella sp. zg-1178]|uniref:DNA repair protein RecN n=1 Tax=Gemella sp. zg-1178 TaxID=2840372 RepID=UPI001C05A193|nr:DNA repair protein RecN [Gemella sp. zg-1178]MBU0278831.1 DNA repair protein RecN [Gemella sp. zg-1178]
MLLQLNIKQFGIIEQASIDFNNGFTVLTGETGAGKSMILSAISQLSGQRTSISYIRHGEEKSTIEGVFDFPGNEELNDIFSSLDIELDDLIIIKRDIFSNGKSICRINNTVVNLSTLKKISSFLIDIHEQHDNQTLLLEKKHLFLIDSYGEKILSPFIENYKNNYFEYRKLYKKIEELEEDSSEISKKIDFTKYQINEIEAINLQKNEVENLKSEIDYLSNYEKINSLILGINQNLNTDGGVLEKTYNIKTLLEKLSRHNGDFSSKYQEINDFYYILEDLKYDLSRFNDNLDYDEARLNEMGNRLLTIKSLEKKYMKNADELLIYKDELKNELFYLENYSSNLDELKLKLHTLEKNLLDSAKLLSDNRKKIAEILEKKIQSELKFLCMEKSTIKIDFKYKDFSADGIDDLKILISANLGEPLKSLSKVASGGELSRIMLALKIIFSDNIKGLSIIFDEIDTGVSGKVSQRMAEKIYQLSQKNQILSISHLPQTTALSDYNLYIEKSIIDNRTISKVKYLDEEEKVNEISRMISGNNTTKLSKEHAIEMIKISEKIKKRNCR